MTTTPAPVLIPAKLATVEEDGVRRFADPALRAEMERVVAGLPANRRGLALDINVNRAPGDVVRVGEVLAVQLGGGWSVMQGLAWDQLEGTEFSLGVRWSGK